MTSYASSSKEYDVQSEKLSPRAVKSSSISRWPRALRQAPRTLTGSLRDHSARRGCGVAVVQREFRLVKGGLDPREEIITVGHAFIVLPAQDMYVPHVVVRPSAADRATAGSAAGGARRPELPRSARQSRSCREPRGSYALAAVTIFLVPSIRHSAWALGLATSPPFLPLRAADSRVSGGLSAPEDVDRIAIDLREEVVDAW